MAARNPRLADISNKHRRALESWLVDFEQRWDEPSLARRVGHVPPGSSWRLPALVEMVKIDVGAIDGRRHLKRASIEGQSLAEADSAPTRVETAADRLRARAGSAAVASGDESQWASRIDCRAPDAVMKAVPQVASRRRPPWASRPPLIGAFLFGLIALGMIIITIRTGNGETTLSLRECLR
jgi:hypothetical protein